MKFDVLSGLAMPCFKVALGMKWFVHDSVYVRTNELQCQKVWKCVNREGANVEESEVQKRWSFKRQRISGKRGLKMACSLIQRDINLTINCINLSLWNEYTRFQSLW